MPVVEAEIAVAVAEIERILEGDGAQRVAPCVVDLAGQTVAEDVPEYDRSGVIVADAVVVVLGNGDESGVGWIPRQSAVQQAIILGAGGTGVHVGVHVLLYVVAVVAHIRKGDRVVSAE